MRSKKSFGQHFLKDQSVVRKIIVAAQIKSGETVLEIGPGTGVLTEALIATGARIIAVEADRDLIPSLREKFGDRLTLIQADILRLPRPAQLLISNVQYLISNLPYNIASAVLQKFLSGCYPLRRLVVMVQREVADRILARPGEMGLLSVVGQIYARPIRICNVPPGAFRPIPKVGSTVVRLDYAPSVEPSEAEKVITLAKIAFQKRRKQLARTLADASVFPLPKVQVALSRLGLSASVRPQELSVEQWIELRRFLVV